ncbi:hypothetical protein, partial [Streptomyces tendae]
DGGFADSGRHRADAGRARPVRRGRQASGGGRREQLDFSELDKMLGEAAGKPDLKKRDQGEDGDDGRDEPKGDGSE